MRKPVIAGNWKMYKTIAESVATAGALARNVADASHCDVILAPTSIALAAVVERLKGSNIRVAAQNIAVEPKQGAFTGEVSAEMVLDAGALYAIIGHSERRQYFAETDESVARKVRAAQGAGLTPIVCVGETLDERDVGAAEEVVGRQLRAGYYGLTASEVARTITAYEPVWAIGTGRTATPETAQEMHRFIRSVFTELAGAETADGLRILYGGSVKPDNIAQLMAQPDIDGGLVGGASLEAESFAKIIQYQ